MKMYSSGTATMTLIELMLSSFDASLTSFILLNIFDYGNYYIKFGEG
jgi:hypothetical protein